ncbi:MAG: fumarylacetoacetase [Solirubrobacteraceae bacterium]
MPGSWIRDADGSGFGIENLPYGVVRRAGKQARVVVRIGSHALDLAAVAEAGLLELEPEVFAQPDLNALLELGPDAWARTRARLTELLSAGNHEIRGVPGLVERAVISLERCEPQLPVAVTDYVDFFSSIEHASNAGRIFRPDAEPLAPNWRSLPVGYHGRAATVVVSGTPITRPSGQRAPEQPGAAPTFGPERALDVEVELGFITGPGPDPGAPIPTAAAGDYIFGFVLVNDWSAREIQRWESQPLGPFLGKSFATSISPWVVPLAAVERLRVTNVEQSPPPLEHLRVTEPWALDVDLELSITPDGSGVESIVSRMNSRGLYWNAAQQLAHATSGAARVRAGDLYASGTISGPDRGSLGCLLELSWGGRDAVALAGGEQRMFLEDGDTVVIRAAGERDGVRISFGEVRGRVLPARR